MVAGVVYVDSSALVKLVVHETESAALVAFLVEHPLQATSEVARVEVGRALLRAGVESPARLREVMEHVVMLTIDASITARAAELTPTSLRTIDALHLASALTLGDELESIITYDNRLAEAARHHGLAVVSPG